MPRQVSRNRPNRAPGARDWAKVTDQNCASTVTRPDTHGRIDHSDRALASNARTPAASSSQRAGTLDGSHQESGKSVGRIDSRRTCDRRSMNCRSRSNLRWGYQSMAAAAATTSSGTSRTARRQTNQTKGRQECQGRSRRTFMPAAHVRSPRRAISRRCRPPTARRNRRPTPGRTGSDTSGTTYSLQSGRAGRSHKGPQRAVLSLCQSSGVPGRRSRDTCRHTNSGFRCTRTGGVP